MVNFVAHWYALQSMSGLCQRRYSSFGTLMSQKSSSFVTVHWPKTVNSGTESKYKTNNYPQMKDQIHEYKQYLFTGYVVFLFSIETVWFCFRREIRALQRLPQSSCFVTHDQIFPAAACFVMPHYSIFSEFKTFCFNWKLISYSSFW